MDELYSQLTINEADRKSNKYPCNFLLKVKSSFNIPIIFT